MKRFLNKTFMMLLAMAGLLWHASLALESVSKEDKLAAEIVQLINQQRTQENVSILGADATLQALPNQWAARLARLNRMEHRQNLPTLQKANGFSYMNENLYRFSAVPDAERVVTAWMKSRGHKKNLLSPQAQLGAVAVGFTEEGGTVVVFQGGRK